MLGATLPNPDNFDIPPFNPNQYSYSPFPNSPDPGNQSGLPFTEDIPRDWFMSFDEAHQYKPPKWANENFDSTDSLPGLLNHNPFPNLGQPSTLGNFDPFAQYAFLNNATPAVSSGDISEAEEFSPGNPRPSVPRSVSREATNELSSNAGDEGASDRYRLSSASSYYGTPQANILASEQLGNLDIDDYIKQAEDETRKMQIQSQQYQLMQQSNMESQNSIDSPNSLQMAAMQRPSNASSAVHSPPDVMHPFTVHEAQEYAHMNARSGMQQGKSMLPVTTLTEDPAWSMAPDMSNPMMNLDDDQEDEDWVR